MRARARWALRRAQRRVLDMAVRLAHQEDTMEEAVAEFRAWIFGGCQCGRHNHTLLWEATIGAVSCLKNTMLDSLDSILAQRGGLVVPVGGSWILPDGVQAPPRRLPHVTAMMQAAIAMLNNDADLVKDILIAHERVGGPAYLFCVVMEATGATANMIAAGAMWPEMDFGDSDDDRI